MWKMSIVPFLGWIVFGFSILPASAQTVDLEIENLISQMTTQEKAQLLIPTDFGSTYGCPRLGIPPFHHLDGPRGVRAGNATCFPSGPALAATWDMDLVYRIGMAMGKEFRVKGATSALGPCLDLARDPRAGRAAEGLGEDPYLASRVAVAQVLGIQSQDVIAVLKHYNLNNKESDRNSNNDVIDRRTLVEYYGLPFRKAVQEGEARGVMGAYTGMRIDDEASNYSCENFTLLTDVLKREWGFPYFVISDWGAIYGPGQLAFAAGCDVAAEWDDKRWKEGSPFWGIPGWISSGLISEERLNDAVRRVLRALKAAHWISAVPKPVDASALNSLEHQQLCKEAAEKCTVLLKNQGGILPLDKNAIRSIALIGPSADNGANLLGDGGSAWVDPFYTITVRRGMEEILGAAKIRYAQGCTINTSTTSDFENARNLAASSDVAVFVGGCNQDIESEGYLPAGDRETIDLPGVQRDLIHQLSTVNPNLIVVLIGSGAMGIENCLSDIKGLFLSYYPGQEGGRGIARLMFGEANPSGKLASTFAKNDSQLPPWNDDYTRDLVDGRGYRWFDTQGITPEFPFGFGLSYTTFDIRNLKIATSEESASITANVTNSGLQAGTEIVQLYLSHPEESPVPFPPKQLKGFQRIPLDPGETKTVTFQLTADELSYYESSRKQFVVAHGNWIARVGSSSDSLPLSQNFLISSPRSAFLRNHIEPRKR